MLPVELIKPLPTLIQKPVRVFRSKSEEDTAVFQLSILHEGNPVIVVAKHGRHRDFGMVYLVTTIHPRPRHQLEAWIELGLLLYPKEKISQVSPQDSAQCNSGQQAV